MRHRRKSDTVAKFKLSSAKKSNTQNAIVHLESVNNLLSHVSSIKKILSRVTLQACHEGVIAVATNTDSYNSRILVPILYSWWLTEQSSNDDDGSFLF